METSDPISESLFNRSARVLGGDAMASLESIRVIQFGVGGVGSWCAEALIRSGLHRLTLVDSDTVAASNVNRQAMATCRTIGRPKVEAMRDRLLEINPRAEIGALAKRYTEATAEEFNLADYDVIIDCIDSLTDKASLILRATALPVLFVSSMGAAMKTHPQQVETADFWKVKGCPLAATLRRRLRRGGNLPSRSFECVYSAEEPAANALPEEIPAEPRAMGSLVQVTAVFGFTLASLVINSCLDKAIHACPAPERDSCAHPEDASCTGRTPASEF